MRAARAHVDSQQAEFRVERVKEFNVSRLLRVDMSGRSVWLSGPQCGMRGSLGCPVGAGVRVVMDPSKSNEFLLHLPKDGQDGAGELVPRVRLKCASHSERDILAIVVRRACGQPTPLDDDDDDLKDVAEDTLANGEEGGGGE